MTGEEGNVKDETKKKRAPQPPAADEDLDSDGLDPEERELATGLIAGSDLKPTEAKAYWQGKYKTMKQRIVECTESEESGDMVEKAMECVLKEADSIPYLTEEMKIVVTGLGAIFQDIIILPSTEEMVDQLGVNNKRFIQSLKEEDRESAIKHLFQMVKLSKFIQLAGELKDYLNEVSYATVEVDNALKSLSGLSQAEGATLGNVVGTGTRGAIEREQKRHKASSVQVNEPKTVNWDDPFRHILDNPQDLNRVLELKVDDHQLTKKLRFVWKSLEQYLDRAEFIQHDAQLSKAVYKQKVGKDMKELCERVSDDLRKKKYEEEEEYKEEEDITTGRTRLTPNLFQACLNSRPQPQVPPPCAPGAHAFEVEGTQQWLSVVTRLIGQCLHPPFQENPASLDTTSSQVNVSPESLVQDPRAPGRPKRRADMMLTKGGRHAVVILDDAMQLGGEEKPGSRDNQGPWVLFNEGMSQDLAHAAKSVTVGFNFAGPGVPTHATMFVVNMAAIQVLRLEVEKVGTPDVRLVLYKSKLHPLLSVAQYDRWAATAKPVRQKDFAGFKEKLYGAAFNEGMDSEGMPSGFPVLCSLMQKRRKELFGPAVEAEHDILGDVLGSGSFSVVFRHKKNPKVAVKLSRHGKSRDLHNESEILSRLQGCKNPSPYVTELVERQTKLEVNFQGVKWQLPVLKTKPVGLSSLVACARQRDDEGRVVWLQSMLDGLLAALRYIHNKKIVHRDINPSNIVVCVDKNDKEIPVLTDFSIAFYAGDEKKAIGFSGTVNYTPREVLAMYPSHKHIPKAKHDDASLGLTMATFVNYGSLPWSPILGFPKPLAKDNIDDFKDEMQARIDSAIASVRKLQSQNETDQSQKQKLASEIVKLLNRDEEWTSPGF